MLPILQELADLTTAHFSHRLAPSVDPIWSWMPLDRVIAATEMSEIEVRIQWAHSMITCGDQLHLHRHVPVIAGS